MNRYVIGNPYEETDGNGISDEQRKDMKGDGSVILSASRRTDIPNYYSGWFFNRIKEGYLYVRNPMNAHQISRILLSPEVVDCIVFWTKNPQPMLAGLDALEGYSYYFQFTLTGYGADMEPGVLHKKRCMLPIFQKLSRRDLQPGVSPESLCADCRGASRLHRAVRDQLCGFVREKPETDECASSVFSPAAGACGVCGAAGGDCAGARHKRGDVRGDR